MSKEAGAAPPAVVQNVTAQAGFAYATVHGDIHVYGDGSPVYLLENHRPAPAPDRVWLRELPSRLLNARAQVVAFTGRQQEQQELTGWLEQAPRLAVRWLHAAGGQGKTRLAEHVAAGAAGHGWKVITAVQGVGAVAASPGSQDLRPGGHRGVLLLVDYADRWHLSALIWLLRNSLLHQPGLRARVLLLARTTTGWPALRAALQDPAVQASTSEQPLAPLAGEDTSRQAMFTAVRDSFAAVYALPDPTGISAPQQLDRPEFGLTLTVHVAALVAVDAHATGTPAPTRPEQLTGYLLDREQQHWTRLYEQRTHGLDHHSPPSVMARTVFTAALTGPLPHPDATALLGQIEPELPAERILTDHTRCYPATSPAGDTVLEPLYPDRLAEDFLALTLPGSDHPAPAAAQAWAANRLHRLLQQPPPPPAPRRWWQRRQPAPPPPPQDHAYLPRTITFLTAATARWPHLGPTHLYPLLRERPQLALTAGSAAITTLTAIPDIDLDILQAIESLLPEHRHVDLDIAAAAITTRLTAHRLAATSDPVERARHLAIQAWRLSNAGQREQALTSAEEAVGIYRQLAEADPDTYLSQLAGSLGELGNYLSEIGQHEQALPPTREAAGMYRQLAEADPDTYLSQLAGSLGNLGNRLSTLGRHEEALPPTVDAATIHHRLATGKPGTYLPDLATSLSGLAIRLSEVGQHEQALSPAEDAVAIRCRLAEANPDAYLPDLATSLSYLAFVLSRLRRHEQALSPAEDAVTIRCRLAEANPDAYLPDLATSVANFGHYLSEVGRHEQALILAEEATVIRRRLAAAIPDAYLADLAMSLTSLGQRLREAGQQEQALIQVEEAVGICRRLAGPMPAVYLPRLAGTLSDLANHRSQLGLHEQALAAAEEAVTIRRRLVFVNPDANLPDLAASLSNLGLVLSRLDRPERALAAAEEAVTIRRRLVTITPNVYLPDLAETLGAYASVCLNLKVNLPQALDAGVEARNVYRRLAEQSPHVYAGHFLLAYRTVADVLDALGRTAEAAAIYRQLDEAAGGSAG